MRERIPLLAPLACALGWSLSAESAPLWLAALAGSLVTLVLAAPTLYRTVSPLPLPSLRLPRWSGRRILRGVAMMVCVAGGGAVVSSLFGLALDPGNTSTWTHALIWGMLGSLTATPVAVFMSGTDPHANPSVQAANAKTREANAPDEAVRTADAEHEPSDFIPEPMFTRNLSQSQNSHNRNSHNRNSHNRNSRNRTSHNQSPHDRTSHSQSARDQSSRTENSRDQNARDQSSPAQNSSAQNANAQQPSAPKPSASGNETDTAEGGSGRSSEEERRIDEFRSLWSFAEDSSPSRGEDHSRDAGPSRDTASASASSSARASSSETAAASTADTGASSSEGTGGWEPEDWPDFNYDV